MFKKYFEFKKYRRATNKGYIKPLIKIGSIISLFPPYDFETERKTLSNIYLCYAFAVSVISLILHNFSFFNYMTYVFGNCTFTEIILEAIDHTFLVLSIFVPNMMMIFGNNSKYYEIIERFLWMDHKFENSILRTMVDNYDCRNTNIVAYEITLITFLFTFVTLYDWWTRQSVHLFIYMYIFLWLISLLLIFNLVFCVRFRFKILNNILGDLFTSNSLRSKNLKFIYDVFDCLSDIVLLINDKFGWTMMCFSVLCLVSLLTSVNVALIRGTSFIKEAISGIIWTIFILVSRSMIHFFKLKITNFKIRDLLCIEVSRKVYS